MNHLISVVVPLYNVERYLKECLNSIIAQTYTNFELLLVDDGSSDSSFIICEEYSKKDNRIKLFHQSNGGVTSARRLGWINSTGSWIVFVDADDTITHNCLALLLDKAIKNNCDVVNASFIYSSNGRKMVHRKKGFMTRDQYLESLMLDQTYGTVYASIYKRNIIRESTFQFDASIKIGEDAMFCIELGHRVNKVLNTHDIIYRYNDMNSSTMSRYVIHPVYLERCYNLRINLYAKMDDLVQKYRDSREIKLCNDLLEAFFNPNIPFDDTYYEHLKIKICRLGFSNIVNYNKIYAIALYSRRVAKMLKFSVELLKNFHDFVRRKERIKREILY